MHFLTDWWLAHYDPFFGWLALGFLIAVGVSWLSWFFPMLRSIAGAVVLSVAAALAGMRKGQHIERDRQAARERNSERGWRPW